MSDSISIDNIARELSAVNQTVSQLANINNKVSDSVKSLQLKTNGLEKGTLQGLKNLNDKVVGINKSIAVKISNSTKVSNVVNTISMNVANTLNNTLNISGCDRCKEGDKETISVECNCNCDCGNVVGPECEEPEKERSWWRIIVDFLDDINTVVDFFNGIFELFENIFGNKKGGGGKEGGGKKNRGKKSRSNKGGGKAAGNKYGWIKNILKGLLKGGLYLLVFFRQMFVEIGGLLLRFVITPIIAFLSTLSAPVLAIIAIIAVIIGLVWYFWDDLKALFLKWVEHVTNCFDRIVNFILSIPQRATKAFDAFALFICELAVVFTKRFLSFAQFIIGLPLLFIKYFIKFAEFVLSLPLLLIRTFLSFITGLFDKVMAYFATLPVIGKYFSGDSDEDVKKASQLMIDNANALLVPLKEGMVPEIAMPSAVSGAGNNVSITNSPNITVNTYGSTEEQIKMIKQTVVANAQIKGDPTKEVNGGLL